MRNDRFWRLGNGTCERVTCQMPMRRRQCTLERFSLLRPGESLCDLFQRYEGMGLADLQAGPAESHVHQAQPPACARPGRPQGDEPLPGRVRASQQGSHPERQGMRKAPVLP
jgi:hypothetical protein